MRPDDTPLKTCTRCKRELPATREFWSPNRTGRFGLQGRCKPCLADLQRKRSAGEPEYARDPLPDGFLRCRHCGLVAPATPETFHSDKRRKYGLDGLCRACFGTENRKWRKAHPDRVRAYEEKPERKAWKSGYNPAYYAAHRKEIFAKAAPRVAAWSHAHPERMAAATARWRKRNPDKTRAQDRRYRCENPDKCRAKDQRRRARMQNAPGSHTAADITAQRRRQSGRCYWCGVKVGRRYHVDHVIPLALGGSNGKENIVIACAHCNQSKGAKMPHEFSQRLC